MREKEPVDNSKQLMREMLRLKKEWMKKEAQFELQLEAEREKCQKIEEIQPTRITDYSADLERLTAELRKEKESKFKFQQHNETLLLQVESLKYERDTTLTLYTNVKQELERRKESIGSEASLHHRLDSEMREKERQTESLRELHEQLQAKNDTLSLQLEKKEHCISELQHSNSELSIELHESQAAHLLKKKEMQQS